MYNIDAKMKISRTIIRINESLLYKTFLDIIRITLPAFVSSVSALSSLSAALKSVSR
jgi:hypothetical protein